MIVFECPACNRKLTVADGHAGKKMACPNCKGKITIPPDNRAAPPMNPAGILNAKTQLAPSNGGPHMTGGAEFEDTARPSLRKSGSSLVGWLALITAVLTRPTKRTNTNQAAKSAGTALTYRAALANCFRR